MQNKLTSEQELEVIELYKRGVSATAIGKQYGVSNVTVYNIKKRHGVEATQIATWDLELRRRISSLYKEGWLVQDIAKEMKLCVDTISKCLILEGHVDMNDRGRKSLRQVKNNPFEDLSSPVNQYWLGLLATDGAISKNKVQLGLKDKDLVEKFAEYVGGLKVNTYKDPRYDDCYIYYCSFCNKDVVAFLESIGITKRKSFTIKMNIPLTFPFVRGVIDGNGCVRKESQNSGCVSICTASSDFAEQLTEFFNSNGFTTRNYAPANMYTVSVSRYSQLIRLYSLLYNDAEVFLGRKEKILREIIRKENAGRA